PDGGAMVSGISRAQSLIGVRVDSNGIDQPDMTPACNSEASRLQRRLDTFWKVLLHHDSIRQPLMVKPRRVDGRLRIHAQAHPVDYAQQRRGNDRGPAG